MLFNRFICWFDQWKWCVIFPQSWSVGALNTLHTGWKLFTSWLRVFNFELWPVKLLWETFAKTCTRLIGLCRIHTPCALRSSVWTLTETPCAESDFTADQWMKYADYLKKKKKTVIITSCVSNLWYILYLCCYSAAFTESDFRSSKSAECTCPSNNSSLLCHTQESPVLFYGPPVANVVYLNMNHCILVFRYLNPDSLFLGWNDR